MGIEEITPLPRLERTHRATPNVIKNIESNSRMCCQANPINLSFRILIIWCLEGVNENQENAERNDVAQKEADDREKLVAGQGELCR